MPKIPARGAKVKSAKKTLSSKKKAIKTPLSSKTKKNHTKSSTSAKKIIKTQPSRSSKKTLTSTQSPIRVPKKTAQSKKSIPVTTKSSKTPFAIPKDTLQKNKKTPLKDLKPKPISQSKKTLKSALSPKPIAPKPSQHTLSSKKSLKIKAQKTGSPAPVLSPEKSALLLKARHRPNFSTFMKRRARRNTQIFFSMEDVKQVISTRKEELDHSQEISHKGVNAPSLGNKVVEPKLPRAKASIHQAASLMDILGFNPHEKKKPKWQEYDSSRVSKKFMPFFKALVALRHHVQEGLELHTQDTLKRSSKDDSGDLSGYSQHIADAGTDTFDRDLALSLVSNEQDLLYEIDEAIHRIFDGTYGVCEITGETIGKERLLAVPFTRFSLQGQKEHEKVQRQSVQRGAIFSEIETESSGFSSHSGGDDDESDL